MYFAEVMERRASTAQVKAPASRPPFSASHPVIRPREHSPVGPVLVVVACIMLLIGLTVLSAWHAHADRDKARSTPRQMPMIHLDG